MTNRLVRYETTLLRRSFSDAFARRRDQLLLLLMLTLAALWLHERVGEGIVRPLPPWALWLALLAFVPALVWQRRLAARLGWMTEHSVIAEVALRPQARAVYLVLGHALLALPILGAAVWLGLAVGQPVLAVGLAALAAAAGVAAGNLPLGVEAGSRVTLDRPSRSMGSRGAGRRAVLRLILARQTFIRGNPVGAALAMIAAVFGLTLAAAALGRGQPEPLPTLLLLMPLSFALIACSRLDASLFSFLSFAGYDPVFTGSAVTLLPLACGIAASTVLVLTGPTHASVSLLLAALLTGLAIVAGLARAWLYPCRSKRAVDFQLQIEFVGLVLIGVLAPPLVALALLWRLGRFYGHASRQLWLQH